MIRVGGGSTILNNDTNVEKENTEINEPAETIPQKEDKKDTIEEVENDINYSYSYTITYDGNTDVYLGKRVDNKEKFTLVKNGETIEYAILDDNYLILENGVYHITDSLNTNIKYCDVEKILNAIENEIPTENGNSVMYKLSNATLASTFKDTLTLDNKQLNSISMVINNNNLKSVTLDLSNYISSITGTTHTLTINMEYANIGTTENFDIKIN